MAERLRISTATNTERRAGFCAWFTGLSGAGKTTTAEALKAQLEDEGRLVTMIDGDALRERLPNLGFGREARDTNVRLAGYVAKEIVFHGGIALCSLVSPYRDTRDEVRAMFPEDSFLEVHVATPLATCEDRDVKGLYRRARSGEIQAFTGISDPYEEPRAPEIKLNTTEMNVEQNVELLMADIVRRGFVQRSV